MPQTTDNKLRKLRLVMAGMALILIAILAVLKKISAVNNDEIIIALILCGAYFLETLRSYSEN